MASKGWQHPYVNIFKHVKVEEWKKTAKEGDVSTYTDKTLKCPVFRISGPLPANSFIHIPKKSNQSLGLTGRFFYLLFRPTPGKYFVVHLDVATEEGQVVRISFSNMFKVFKSTPTWLQFPFLCGAAKDSVYDNTSKSARHGLVGSAPSSVRWTCLMLDLQYMLSVYANRCHSHLKSIRLCANMSVKNMFTSDLLLNPGETFSDLNYSKYSWHDFYDHIRLVEDDPPIVTLSKAVQDRVSLIKQVTTPEQVKGHIPPHAAMDNIVKLLPDPILRLKGIIGFGGGTSKCALWTKAGDAVVYPCHAIIVSMKINTNEQRFFIGHSDKVAEDDTHFMTN
uniref:CFA20 domain-containing protein n=1 Tax=Gouania willdenowi TaxID=441366 RepID=A0A8C5EEC2_GOUWI